jgi:hypothetical protein
MVIRLVAFTRNGSQMFPQNPAFGAPQIRELTPIFIAKAIEVRIVGLSRQRSTLTASTQLRDILASQTVNSEALRVDIFSWLNKAALDIIGLAGPLIRYSSTRNRI